MTEPIQPELEGPDVTIGTVQGDMGGPPDSPTPPDLGYPGMGYGIDDASEPRLQTFDEMLPATRAFHRNSSKS